jgi:hypothetical protein
MALAARGAATARQTDAVIAINAAAANSVNLDITPSSIPLRLRAPAL